MNIDDLRREALKSTSEADYAIVCALLYVGDAIRETPEGEVRVEPEIPCTVCHGQACEEGCGRCERGNAGPDSHRLCRHCSGAGVEP